MTIVLPEAIHESLRALAATNERSLSGEIRWALKRYSEDPETFGG